jgi:triosephosphate isomerase
MGNWKMNRGGPEAEDLARSVVEALGGTAPESVEVALLPPHSALAPVGRALEGTGVLLGAQSCHPGESGAFTGETAALSLAGWGCTFVLCGHSERRRLFGEDDAAVAARVAAALEAGLRPVLCVGETLEEREAGRTAGVITGQVGAGIEGLDGAAISRIEIAYEPVWAIGTGRTATPEQASEGHRMVREALSGRLDAEAAGAVRVLYGGSVNPGNAEALLSAPGVDGALVGGASLEAAGFAAIVKAAAAAGAGVADGGR